MTLYSIDPEIALYLEDINHAEESLIRPIPKSAGYLTPGAVVLFKYDIDGVVESRLALVVSNQRGNGVFTSTRGNRLMSCFRLTDVFSEVGSIILRHLNRNRRLNNYYLLADSLTPIFNKESYRTYNLNKVTGLHKVRILKPRLPLPEED